MIDDEEIESSEVDLDRIISKRQHKELVSVLGKILTAMDKLKAVEKNTELQSLVSDNKSMINQFVSKLQELTKPQAINIETNQNEVVNSVNKASENIIKAIADLSKKLDANTAELKRPKEVEATITKRNFKGFVDEINFKVTKAKYDA